MTDLANLSAAFQRFSAAECDRSPLYRTLTSAIAGDGELLALAAQATSYPKTNLFLASVHYLLLRGADHELRRFYPSVGGAYIEGDPVYPAFRNFCLAHREEILPLLQSRRVQTNEVARAAILLPAFGVVAARTQGAPLAIIEVGTSAGLLLLWDRYRYEYGDGRLYGDAASPVHIRCEARGDQRPPIPEPFPKVVKRVGIDLHPVNLRDPDDALWLRALVWPDQAERADRLARAIDLAAAERLHLVAGDALEAMPETLADVSAPAVPVVFHCHTLNQFRPEDRERFTALLAAASEGRTLYQVALEYAMEVQAPEVRLQTFRDGALVASEPLARYQAHGDWINWSLQAERQLVY